MYNVGDKITFNPYEINVHRDSYGIRYEVLEQCSNRTFEITLVYKIRERTFIRLWDDLMYFPVNLFVNPNIKKLELL